MPIIQKPKTPQASKPTELDLDLGLDVDLDLNSKSKKVEKNEENAEQSTLILDLSLDTPRINPPLAKAASEVPKEIKAGETKPAESKTTENKTGVVFSKPNLSR